MFLDQWHQGLSVLAIFAHPDDAELISYGALRKIAYGMGNVSLVVATNGAEGRRVDENRDDTLIDQRRQETRRAIEPITADVTFLDFADGTLSMNGPLISAIERIVNEKRPAAIFTHFNCPNGVDHQDHTAIAKAVLNISWRKNFVKYLFSGEPISPGTSFYPNALIDITDFFDEKCDSLTHHRSQQGRAYLERGFHLNRASRWNSLSPDGRLYEGYRLEKALLT